MPVRTWQGRCWERRAREGQELLTPRNCQLLFFNFQYQQSRELKSSNQAEARRKRVRNAVAAVLKSVSAPAYPSPSSHRPQTRFGGGAQARQLWRRRLSLMTLPVHSSRLDSSGVFWLVNPSRRNMQCEERQVRRVRTHHTSAAPFSQGPH